MRLRPYTRCDAAGCDETRRLIFVAAVARMIDDSDDTVDTVDLGLRLCPLHAKLALNGLHVALRSDKPNPHGTLVLVGRGTPRIGIIDDDGDEVLA